MPALRDKRRRKLMLRQTSETSFREKDLRKGLRINRGTNATRTRQVALAETHQNDVRLLKREQECTGSGNRRRGAKVSEHSICCGQARHSIEELIQNPGPSQSCHPPGPAGGRPRLRRPHPCVSPRPPRKFLYIHPILPSRYIISTPCPLQS